MSKNTMTLTQAVSTGKIKNVIAAVEAAVKDYPADMPEEPTTNSILGCCTPFAALDKESKMQIIEQEVMMMSLKVHSMNPKSKTFDIDVAMLIANNPVLRHAGSSIKGGKHF